MAGAAFAVLVAAGGCSAPEGSGGNRVDAIREWVYENTDVAADRTHLFTPAWGSSLSDIIDVYRRDEAGVWCGGAAHTLYLAYREAGYEAWIFHYGIRGLLTHAINLVEVDGVLYAHDAYFNRHYPRPFFEVLETLASGRPVEVTAGVARIRDVHLTAATQKAYTWTTAGQEGIACRGREDGGLTCRAETSAKNFVTYDEKVGPTLDRLEADGFPRDLDFLLLYPFAITGPDGYADDPASPRAGGLLGRIHAITGRLGGQRRSERRSRAPRRTRPGRGGPRRRGPR